jgi:hypothetical protein
VIPLPYKLLAVAVLLAVTFLSGAGLGRSWERGQQAKRDLAEREQAAEMARIESKAEAQKAAEVLAYTQDLRSQISRLRSSAITLSQGAANNAFSKDLGACLDPDRVRDLNAAIGAANGAAAGASSTVPAAAQPAGR